MMRLLAASATLALLAAAAPSLAAPKPVFGACKAPAGATLVKAGAKAVESNPDTPIGAAESSTEPAGTFVLDLSGKPQSATGTLTFALSWANPVSDYDLVIGGSNDLSSDNPEVRVLKARHCKPVPVQTTVFLGVPVDELTLAVKGS